MIEVFIGVISGIVTAMGMGGGSVLILLLTMILGVSQKNAQAVNLIFFIPTSITAIFLNIKNKNIDYKTGIFVIIFGIVGALIGANLASNIDTDNLRKFFRDFFNMYCCP